MQVQILPGSQGHTTPYVCNSLVYYRDLREEPVVFKRKRNMRQSITLTHHDVDKANIRIRRACLIAQIVWLSTIRHPETKSLVMALKIGV